ncbi:MAG: hypothetical protein M0Z95_28625 [Actinomycetota bacterium]|nr:hypothetical protein [Actinomycetota bacterium]
MLRGLAGADLGHPAPAPDEASHAGAGLHGDLSQRTQVTAEKRGPGATLLLLVLPVLCCGGPAIFAALAAASAATLGLVGGIIGTILLAVAIGLFVRRRRRAVCCAERENAWSR